MAQDKIPPQRHIALKKPRHLSLKVTGHGGSGCAEIPEFLDGPFACRALTMPP